MGHSMIASSRKLLTLTSEESKEDRFYDIRPSDFMGLPFSEPVTKLVVDYAWPVHKMPFLFRVSDVDYLHERIIYFAQHAGPLAQFKSYLTKFFGDELKKKDGKGKSDLLLDKIITIGNHRGTFVQCLAIGLDRTIVDEKGNELVKGMTETFIEVVQKFCNKGLLPPEKVAELKAQVYKVSPPEDEKAIAAIKNVVEKLFEGLVSTEEEETQQAIETFKKFTENMKRQSMNEVGELIDARLYIGIIRLIEECRDILARIGAELPGGHYGKKGDLLVWSIIGNFLESLDNIPPCLRQLLMIRPWGLYSLFRENKKPDRDVFDVTGDIFRGIGTDYRLGENSYYDDYGPGRPGRRAGGLGFFKLIASNYSSIQTLCPGSDQSVAHRV